MEMEEMTIGKITTNTENIEADEEVAECHG
jgi:hypothetical protein